MRIALLLLLTCVCGLGCASRDMPPMDFSVRMLSDAERGQTIDRAEAVLKSLGYSIARRDTARGVVVSEPIALEAAGERSVRADNAKRKIAEVRFAETADSKSVYCKVIIQEQSYENYRLLAYERGGDDLPGHQTAIDRDAATTAEQNTVWRTIRRDRVAERQILDHIGSTDDLP